MCVDLGAVKIMASFRILVLYLIQNGLLATLLEAKLCPFIFEEGRQACGAHSQSDCESLGCCWDPEATDAGLRCYQHECLPGRFGWGCRFQCQCQEGDSCDQLSGNCTLGCPSQKWGVGCLLDNACTYNDKYGTSYMGRMVRTQGGHTCGRWTQQRAYPDSHFPDGKRALAENYCRNPLPKDYRTWCYYSFGSNRRWDYCVLGKCECPRGRFDINCARECHCGDSEEQCHSENGSCLSGCDVHWTGDNCQECADGRFGELCEYECHCQNTEDVCDKLTGICQSGCAEGWTNDDCNTECDDGYFGYNCEYSCNCASPDEVCDKQNGTCATGCREGYSGSGCQIQVPVLTLPPKVDSRDASSITVSWKAWKRPPDRGDGPVSDYELSYKAVDDSDWKSNGPDGVQRVTVRDLRRGTQYQFHVRPVHERGILGFPSPELNASTCGMPLAGPAVVDVELLEKPDRGQGPAGSPDLDIDPDTEDGQVQLRLDWQLPVEDLWGCDAVERYKVYFKEEHMQHYQSTKNVDVKYTVIQGVDVYTNYTIGVSYINNASMESPLTTTTYVGRSGAVESLRASAADPTSLLVTWAPPWKSNGAILYYLIRYKELRIGNCEVEHSSWTPKIDHDEQSYMMTGLHPYARYKVRVWVQTPAGQGLLTETTGTTKPAVPSAPVKNFHIDAVEATTASFSWDPPECESRHGEFLGYKYEFRERQQNSWPAVLRHITNTTQLTVDSLTPYTTYSVTVWFANHAFNGPQIEPRKFVTEEDVPPPPANVHVGVARNSLLISWETPYPPHGLLQRYQLNFWSRHQLHTTTTVFVVASDNEYQINDLHPNTSYGVQMRAYTNVGPGEWSETIFGFTDEAPPGPPEAFVNISRDANSITFQWQDPLIQNGIIRKYKILCTPLTSLGKYLARDVEVLLDPWEHVYQVMKLQPGTGYVCLLSASTSKGYGQAIRKTFWTEPKIPVAPDTPKLEATKSTDQTVTVRLQPNKYLSVDIEHSKSAYRVVVERMSLAQTTLAGGKVVRRSAADRMPCGLDNSQLLSYSQAVHQHVKCYIAAEISNIRGSQLFVVGDNRTYGGYHNVPLEKGESYDLWYGVVVTVDGVTASRYSKMELTVTAIEYNVKEAESGNTAAVAGAMVGIILTLLVAIILIGFLVMKRKRARRGELSNADTTESERIDSTGKVFGNRADKVVLPDLCSTNLDESIEFAETEPLYDNAALETLHKPIDVEYLWNYVKEKKGNKFDGFKQEYDELPLGLRAQCDVAKKQDNRTKNRYGNIVAYDHSRIILECLPDDPQSDYINANYIDGYRRPNSFIATQGPSKLTLNDIWRMAWQENSHRIVMVTNLVEDGRHKCEPYWPDGGSKDYGDVTVEHVDTEQFADFTIRTFNMSKEGVHKVIYQFHFTTWPDHGVPAYATSLLAFRKKVRSFDDPTSGPTIVHCSAGVGRSGTFIALDHLLDMAKVEGQVDIYHCVQNMRTKRVNMVQTQEQYVFVYDALLEALKSGDTSYPCTDFRKCYHDLKKVNPDTGRVQLEEQFELLSTMAPLPDGTNCRDALDSENVAKNRFQDIVPLGNLSRPYLLTYIPGSTDYINGVFADGYKQRDAHIITQMPLPITMADFWAMIYDHDCHTIIMMNPLDPDDKTCGCYFPQETGSQEHGPFTVETIALDTSADEITVRDMSLTHNKRGSTEPRFVRLLQFNAWPTSEPVPPSRSAFISLLTMVEKWQQRSGNHTIVVHCMDGAKQSGLYCAVSYMVERLKVEQEVDVFQSVKHTRINRPRIVPTLEQYQFIYDMAVEYMDCFETYANFK